MQGCRCVFAKNPLLIMTIRRIVFSLALLTHGVSVVAQGRCERELWPPDGISPAHL